MRTKQLLITAALTAAGLSAATAASHSEAVFSANAVGFVNVDLPQGFALITNPLDAEDNTVASLFADAADNTTVFKFNGGGFDQTTKDEFDGWLDTAMTLEPGEGMFVNSPSEQQITFVGEVMQGSLSVTLNDGFSVIGSMVPQAGGLESDLGLTPAFNDNVYKFVDGGFAQSTFDEFDGWLPSEPQIEVAEAFFINRSGGGSWDRDFDVNAN